MYKIRAAFDETIVHKTLKVASEAQAKDIFAGFTLALTVLGKKFEATLYENDRAILNEDGGEIPF